MHHKDIKRQIKKQLNTQYPHWKRLSRKKKKEIAKKLLEVAVKKYDFEKDVTIEIYSKVVYGKEIKGGVS